MLLQNLFRYSFILFLFAFWVAPVRAEGVIDLTASADDSSNIFGTKQVVDINQKSAVSNAQQPLSPEERKLPLKNMSREAVIEMAERGHPEAQMKLGYAYATGTVGFPRDRIKSFEWTKKAAEQGNMKAQYNLALDYHAGIAVKKDLEKTRELLRKSAAQGFEPAIKIIDAFDASEENYGNPLPVFDVLVRDAEAGSLDAAYGLGNIYMEGSRHMPKDAIKARRWYKKAAEQGHTRALFALASLDMKTGHKDKFKWTMMAAKEGHPESQYNLSLFYGTQGDGTPYDEMEAYAWMRTAQASGIKGYTERSIFNVERAIIYNKDKADALAQEYISKYVKKR
jgi:TPR repeat protein